MEPMVAHPFHESYGLTEAMDCDDNPPYPFREARDSELLNAFGKNNPYQIESNWITQGYNPPSRGNSDGYSSQSSEAIVSVSMVADEAPCGLNSGAPQRFQRSTALDNRPSSTESTPGPFDTACQHPSFGYYDGSEDYKAVHEHFDNTDHDFPPNTNSTRDVTTGLGTGGFLVPQTTVPDVAQGTRREHQYAEGPASGAPQETGKGIDGPPFPSLPQEIDEHPPSPEDHPMISRYPSGSNHILKFLKRNDRGGATCLWAGKGYTCGFFSQVDLVKRHIKRMHYCLK